MALLHLLEQRKLRHEALIAKVAENSAQYVKVGELILEPLSSREFDEQH